MAVVDANMQIRRWTHRPDHAPSDTAAAVREFAADHGMSEEPQRRLEAAVDEALVQAVGRNGDDPVGLAQIEAALDSDWMTVRIERPGLTPSARTLVRLGTLVERVESCGPQALTGSVITLECVMSPRQMDGG
jgi:hypothetical protein